MKENLLVFTPGYALKGSFSYYIIILDLFIVFTISQLGIIILPIRGNHSIVGSMSPHIWTNSVR